MIFRRRKLTLTVRFWHLKTPQPVLPYLVCRLGDGLREVPRRGLRDVPRLPRRSPDRGLRLRESDLDLQKKIDSFRFVKQQFMKFLDSLKQNFLLTLY